MLAVLGLDDGTLALALLAVVQGVTEFLPVSSSGHLALGQWLMGIGEGSLLEDVVLHAGTLVAVLVFYRRDLVALVKNSLAGSIEDRRYIGLLLIGNVPAAIVGLGFKDQFEVAFDRPGAVLVAMAATAILLWTTRRFPRREESLNLRKALLIGLAQAVAIFPGASRSGWTIAIALALGLRPVEAARFSFLLSVPAISGAILLQFSEAHGAAIAWGPLVVGFVVAAVTGLLCLRWLVRLVRRMALHLFAPYLALVVALVGIALATGAL